MLMLGDDVRAARMLTTRTTHPVIFLAWCLILGGNVLGNGRMYPISTACELQACCAQTSCQVARVHTLLTSDSSQSAVGPTDPLGLHSAFGWDCCEVGRVTRAHVAPVIADVDCGRSTMSGHVSARTSRCGPWTGDGGWGVGREYVDPLVAPFSRLLLP